MIRRNLHVSSRRAAAEAGGFSRMRSEKGVQLLCAPLFSI
jgi:hypothetical protein